jgi:4-aminobutyrate aminotransferase-like enzyme
MLLLSAVAYAQVIRIIPPLVTTAEEVDLALKILEESLDAAGVKRS